METISKYQPFEILEFIQSIYRQQQQVDSMAIKGRELTFDTTIEEWRDICDLLETDGLAKCYNDAFRLDMPQKVWRTILEPAEERTLGDFCHFIAQHAQKEVILPISLLGQQCETAAIFRKLMANLQRRGVNTASFSPSTKLQPLLHKHTAEITEEVSLISPHALPPIRFKENNFSRIGLNMIFIALLATIIFAIANSSIAYWMAGLMVMGTIMVRIGAKFPPKQMEFEGINTLGDLVKRMANAPNTQ